MQNGQFGLKIKYAKKHAKNVQVRIQGRNTKIFCFWYKKLSGDKVVVNSVKSKIK